MFIFFILQTKRDFSFPYKQVMSDFNDVWDKETKGIPFFFLPKGLLPLPLFLTHDSTPMEDGHWECQLSFRKGSEPTWSRPIPYGLTLVSTKWRFQGIIVYWYKRSLCNSKGWEKESRGLFSFTRRRHICSLNHLLVAWLLLEKKRKTYLFWK